MKATSVQGYVLGLTFLKMYEEDKTMALNEQLLVKKELEKIAKNLILKKHNIKKQITKAWNTFTGLVNEDYAVDALTFAFHLVIKNPTIQKNKRLLTVTMEANKMFMFKKELEIQQSKKLVNRFYGVN